MKKLIVFIILIIENCITVYNQCDVNVQDVMNLYCKGEYLMHRVIDNRSDSVFSLIMQKFKRYTIYFLNPSNELPHFEFIKDSKNHIKDFNYRISKDQNYSAYSIVPDTEEPISFMCEFQIPDYACALLALYYQNTDNFKPGIYNTFEDFKNNSSSDKLPSGIKSDLKKIGLGKNAHEIILYRLDINRENAKKYDKIFGFSDGQTFYINYLDRNVRPATGFVELELINDYGYFEYMGYMVTGTGATTVTMPYLEQKIIDLGTGEIKTLNNNLLKMIISDDNELLQQFNNEKNKNKKLKDYLYMYANRKK